jgi:iron complex transport system ATP-binding protein
MVMMKGGRIERAGPPAEVMTDDAMEAVFGCRMRINGVPASGAPFVLPHTASS